MTTTEFTNPPNDTSVKIEEKGDKSKDAPVALIRYIEVFVAEFIGTALLMGIGCAACVKDNPNKELTDFHGALTFGFTVSTIIGIFGHISAAHLNPAVTVAFYVLGQIDVKMMLVYFVAEFSGGIVGVGILNLLSPTDWNEPTMCMTLPHASVSEFQAVGVEFLITSFLIFLVCGLGDPRCATRQDSTPLKFAAIITAVSIAFGKYTGASMNPARSLAPALWSGVWDHIWVYFFGPLAAAVVVPLLYTTCFLRKTES